MAQYSALILIFLLALSWQYIDGQENVIGEYLIINNALFSEKEVLPIQLSYSNKDIRRNTNDSTYLKTVLSYRSDDDNWTKFEVEIRARGNFRRKNCYFPPIKMKIDSLEQVGTIFEGNAKLKLVLPCLIQKDNNDNIVKEYIGYQLFEVISPYHFKTRMIDLTLTESGSKKEKVHQVKGILIETDQQVAGRHHGNVLKRFIHPLNHEAVTSVRNAFFQFMIGNTDFSTAYQHNEKLLFIDKKIIPLPYDFDMSGLIDASYAVVSQIQNESLENSTVTERIYRGFKRDQEVFDQVRIEFINHKLEMLNMMEQLAVEFENPAEFQTAKSYISSFFKILEDDSEFQRDIVSQARDK